MATSFFCSFKLLILITLITAIPLAFIISLEQSKHSTHLYQYYSNGYMRECTKWDDAHRRFIVSYFEGGVGQILVPEKYDQGNVLEEKMVIKEEELKGNASLGMVIDKKRNRVLVVNADVKGFVYGGLAAYDLDSWRRVFLVQLSGPGDEKSFADDVAIDEDGNAYVTDCKSSKIWKVGVNGELLSTIRSPLFTHRQWYKDLVSLNGIVYHPDGYLLVMHTIGGKLYKVDIKTEEVTVIKVDGSLLFGDGIELLSPTKLIVAASHPSARLVESLDGWETATVIAKFSGPLHRLATAATVKDGKVYLNHMFGMGFPKKTHTIVEAIFTPIKKINV
ncbi:hypothetical protein ACHQM5_026286 [Ranunculus cassubicifolius]